MHSHDFPRLLELCIHQIQFQFVTFEQPKEKKEGDDKKEEKKEDEKKDEGGKKEGDEKDEVRKTIGKSQIVNHFR